MTIIRAEFLHYRWEIGEFTTGHGRLGITDWQERMACVSDSADGKYEVSYKPNVVIFNHGDVLWIPPAIYKSSCTIDVTYFPFDQQECKMKFGSWTFNGDQVLARVT